MDSGSHSRNSGTRIDQTAEPLNPPQPHRLIVAVVWTVLIMVLCWLPRRLVHDVQDESRWLRLPHLDKLIHWGIFVIFSILWLRVRPGRRSVWLVALSGIALEALTEVVQSLPMIRREMSAADLLTDAVGVMIGIAIAPLMEPFARSVDARLFRVTAATPLPAEPAAGASQARP